MTRDEAIQRLMACPALPRGERLAWVVEVAGTDVQRKNQVILRRKKDKLHGSFFGTCHALGNKKQKETTLNMWRNMAGPLRQAREKAKSMKTRADVLEHHFHSLLQDFQDIQQTLYEVRDIVSCIHRVNGEKDGKLLSSYSTLQTLNSIIAKERTI